MAKQERAKPTAIEIKASIARMVMEHLIDAHFDPDTCELYLYDDENSDEAGNVLSFIETDRCKEVTLRQAFDRIKEIVEKDYDKHEKVVVYTCRDNAMIHMDTDGYTGDEEMDAFNESQPIWIHGGITTMDNVLFFAID